MRAGIIAAGLGVRLGGGPKALTLVGGRTLIDHVLDGLEAAGAVQVTCIVNESSAHVAAHVAQSGRALPIDWIVRSTPSSMHSFLAVLERLSAFGDSRYVISTVDAVCAPATMVSFARQAAALPDADLVLGLTDVIDDEKPLYVDVERRVAPGGLEPSAGADADCRRVRTIGDAAAGSCFVTAGLYAASARILFERDAAVAAGFTALRQFLGHVVSRGYRVYGVPLSAVIDVDRPADVKAAEGLLGCEASAGLPTPGRLT